MLRPLLLATAFIAAAAPLRAEDAREGVYIIYDSSNSMWGELPDSSRKYEAARTAMRALAGEDFGGRDLALRMYGHRRKGDCTDSELVLPWSDPDTVGDALVAAMEAVRPTGRTPIDRSLRAALQDFGDRRGTIILISDGIESCDADPCALVREWQDRDVEIAVHVVGLGLRGKERAAMQCIADAAGTEYRDAFSADDLIAGLGAVVEATEGAVVAPGTPEPAPVVSEARVRLDVTTPDGVAQLGRASFAPVDGGAPIIVESSGRFVVPAGDYIVTGGVVTVDGAVYAPVERPVTVGFDGADMTVLLADVPRPPEVSATFFMEGQEVRDTTVGVYKDGRFLGAFKGDETAFISEGSFEFQTDIAASNQTLTVRESFVAGDAKVIRFEAVTEVRLQVNLHLGTTGEKLLSKPALELFQNGEQVTKINRSSGGFVRPGVYEIRADDGVMRHAAEITVTREASQVMDLVLPAGTLEVTYRDVTGAEEAPKRVFIYPEDGIGGVTKQSAEPIALMPGTYIVEGHPSRAGYPRTEVEVADGQVTRVTLRATE